MKDPPLTDRGIEGAVQVSLTLKEIFPDVKYVYSSKLIRAIQTAYPIARAFNDPLYVSRGLALTALAVSTYDKFEMLRMSEIRALCPHVHVINCDGDDDDNADKSNTSEFRLPADDWFAAIAGASELSSGSSIVVAHRETLRALAGRRLSTPYCCFGIFDRKHDKFELVSIHDKLGRAYN